MRQSTLLLIGLGLAAFAPLKISAQNFPPEDPAIAEMSGNRPAAFDEEFKQPSRIRDILSIDNSLSASYELTRFGFGESSDNGSPAYIDTDNGYLRGAKDMLSLMRSFAGARDLYAAISYQYEQGRAGYSYDGSGLPLSYPASRFGSPQQASTGESIYELALRLGKGFEAGNAWMFTPYLTGGYRYWQRGMNDGASGGFGESYRNGFLGGGEMVQCAPMDRVVLTADASASAMIRPSMYSAPYFFYMQGGPMVDASAEIDYRFWRGLHVVAGFDYSHLSYRQSQVIAVGSANYMEPESITNAASWSVGLRQTF